MDEQVRVQRLENFAVYHRIPPGCLPTGVDITRKEAMINLCRPCEVCFPPKSLRSYPRIRRQRCG